MKKILVSLLSITLLCSFNITPKEISGTWKWVKITNRESGSDMSIEQMTMGMATTIETVFHDDKTYSEIKTSKDGKVSTTEGTWTLDEAGTALTIMRKEKITPAKIVSYSNDTLIVEMKYPMTLVMVREK